jgi:hypothetical protein
MNAMKRAVSIGILLVFAGTFSSFAANEGQQTWKGYVTDTNCGFNRVNKPPTAECTVKCVKNQHAKYAFFNFADKKVYILNPQSEAAKYAGQTVVVKGTISGHENYRSAQGPATGEIISAASITRATVK